MPFYHIEHVCPLSLNQKEALVMAITDAHCKRFVVPSLLVNIRFTDTSNATTYTARKRSSINLITANVRHNASRPTDFYNELMQSITDAWDAHVGTTAKQELHGMVVLGGMVAGVEAGLFIPPAGQDGAWLKENVANMQRKADQGREDFREALRELETRPDLRAAL